LSTFSIIVRRLATMGILVAVFSVSASVVTYMALRGRTVQVPNLIGKTEAEAESLLEDLGLRMQIRGRAHHDKIPEKAVSDQSPAPGTTVKTGQLVRVSLSLGASSQVSDRSAR
jgi:beta-lactam-binding protein with PASTA domain